MRYKFVYPVYPQIMFFLEHSMKICVVYKEDIRLVSGCFRLKI